MDSENRNTVLWNKNYRNTAAKTIQYRNTANPYAPLIINATLRSAQFPFAWKVAEVTPILKDSDQEIPNNYRPISLLPLLSKIRERVAHDQLTSYFDSEPTLDT